LKILVDADACPVTRIVIKIAREREIPVVLVTDDSHILRDDYAEIVTVGQGADAVDYALINRAKAGDVVVTQDYGVAALALGKKAYALNQNGMRYTDGNIEGLLLERHESRKARKAGKRTGGFKKRTGEQDRAFTEELIVLLANITY
jgi:uncharacterized protein YaiI (UPF0178 family)